jgi:hypothetical protein
MEFSLKFEKIRCRRRRMLTQKYVKSILDYDPETGVFTWRPRPLRPGFERTDKAWNTRRVGTEAGTVNVDGYVAINLLGVPRYAHRLAFLWMEGQMPDQVDHRDLDKANNRWENLRPADYQGNAANRGLRADNTSGFKGVVWDARRELWAARIGLNGTQVYLGYYRSKEAAAAAYKAAAEHHFGEFFRVD